MIGWGNLILRDILELEIQQEEEEWQFIYIDEWAAAKNDLKKFQSKKAQCGRLTG